MKTVYLERKNYMIKFAVLFTLLCSVYCCGRLEGPLDFPFDHGPHFNVMDEWWYFTGEILTVEGKTLGFEFTVFKIRLCGQNGFFYLGHLAISDPETSEHFFVEVPTYCLVSGIEEGVADIGINNFSYTFSESEGFTIKADVGNLSVDLSLTPTMDVLPHGEDGIIVMGEGIRSYYYSYTNLSTQGSISVNGFEYTVSSGRAWMDHQWGNYTLFGMIWDWFSLRLEDGGALMLFQFRNVFDNEVRSNWTYRSSTGSIIYGEDLFIQATRVYEDKNGKHTYPIDWAVDIPEIDAMFLIRPLFDAQNLYNVMTPDYWEGLCSVEGTINGEIVSGAAYVEMTGYKGMRIKRGMISDMYLSEQQGDVRRVYKEIK
jgi:predicted secreted hydrolase